jgi:hypothetical protein
MKTSALKLPAGCVAAAYYLVITQYPEEQGLMVGYTSNRLSTTPERVCSAWDATMDDDRRNLPDMERAMDLVRMVLGVATLEGWA